jgi:type VI secretion system protein ImpH
LERLFAALEADASQFDFYHALRHVDAAITGAVPLGRAARPRDEPIRLTQHPSLVFPPGALHQYRPGVAAYGLGRLSVHHFGLFGPNGALPQHLTEYVQERILHGKDETIARFCDIFQHRMILLFYRAWADCQAVTSLDRPERDAFGRYAASLVGLGQASLKDRDTVPDHLKLHHAGHLARQTRNAEGLLRPLAALLRVPVAVQEYCMQWLTLSGDERTRLISVALAGAKSRHQIEVGAASSRLGQGAIVGAKVPDVQHKFRLRLGSMTLHEFERYLPGGVRFFHVRDWVRNYLGVELAWDARLVLKRDEVPSTRLGAYGQLGWTSWLGMPSHRRTRDADDLLLDMERLSRTHTVGRSPDTPKDPHV